MGTEKNGSNRLNRRNFLNYSALSTLALATPGWGAQKRPIRIVVAGISQEANTTRGDFTKLSDCKISRGDEILRSSRGVRDYVGGMMDAAQRVGVELVPTVTVDGGAGPFESAVYETLVKELIERTVSVPNISGIALPLHGAGTVVGIPNLEADLCRRLRAAVGPKVPMVATYDTHGNLSQETVNDLNGAFCSHYNPHTDTFERGRDAVSLLHRIVTEGLAPKVHVENLPMLTVPQTTLFGPAHEIAQLCERVEQENGIIACTFLHGFLYVDRPHVSSSVLVVAKSDRALAERTARRVARAIWDMRERLRPTLTDAPTAIARALREARWPTVLLDSADNPGGMCPGDSTHLLRAMIAADLKEACFASINDREVATQAHAAGRGSRIRINLGGKSLPLNGKPIAAEATVLSLSDGRFQVTNPEGAGGWTELGPCAALQIGGIEVLVSSRPYQPYDPGLFQLHGIDITKRKIVVLKSTSKWRGGFKGLVAQDIIVDTPGYMSRDLTIYEWHQLKRPIWPLDQTASYPASSPRVNS